MLPQTIGPAATLLVQPQRLLESLLLPGTNGFANQRVDFALETGDLHLVFEVDGPQHQQPAQKKQDQRRDKALGKAGWPVERIPVAQLWCDSTVTALHSRVTGSRVMGRLNNVYRLPLWRDDWGRAALQLVLAPFAVARVQRCLLWALESSVLRLDQALWRLVVVERDVRCAVLAVADFLDHLNALYGLLGCQCAPPRIELRVYHTAEFASSAPDIPADNLAAHALDVTTGSLGEPVAEYVDGDLLLDIAMLQPSGFVSLEEQFAKRHLTTQGVAYEIRSCLYPHDVRRIGHSQPHAYALPESYETHLRFFLQGVFRKREFRPGQAKILARSLALKPVIGLLPTGGGKSLCYQLSALLQPGMALVVVPLNSLMLDQVDNLREKSAIDWIGQINGQLDQKAKQQIQAEMAQGRLLITLISPERVQSKEFRTFLNTLTTLRPVTYAVIDEAHCVSEWGHDFRTAYLKLAPTIRETCQHNGHVPVTIALTGTASFSVLSDVQREIGVDDEEAKVYPESFDRSELIFSAVETSAAGKANALLKLLRELPQAFDVSRNVFFSTTGDDETTYAGLVFVPHVNGKLGVLDVSEWLEKQNRAGRQVL